MQDVFNELEMEYWNLFETLKGSYKSKNSQISDMVKLGKLASSMQALRESMGALSHY